MSKYDRKRIKQTAIIRGGSQSWLSFVRSEEVAKRIANDVFRYLNKNGVKGAREQLIQVARDHHYTGTWRVTILRPGVVLNHYPAAEVEADELRSLLVKALQTALKRGDLVTSWSE
ncbi:MAG TPA: hypothetical protein VK502_00455 [Candidatus Saccharimonadales bacterium]|nr:hypothetical protein [Candidatus Saccharimonadales bacterium]